MGQGLKGGLELPLVVVMLLLVLLLGCYLPILPHPLPDWGWMDKTQRSSYCLTIGPHTHTGLTGKERKGKERRGRTLWVDGGRAPVGV